MEVDLAMHIAVECVQMAVTFCPRIPGLTCPLAVRPKRRGRCMSAIISIDPSLIEGAAGIDDNAQYIDILVRQLRNE